MYTYYNCTLGMSFTNNIQIVTKLCNLFPCTFQAVPVTKKITIINFSARMLLEKENYGNKK